MSQGRPRRFPNGAKTVRFYLPTEVIQELNARGGREWLFTALGFDFGPPAKTNTSTAKKAKDASQQGWSVLQAAMTTRPASREVSP